MRIRHLISSLLLCICSTSFAENYPLKVFVAPTPVPFQPFISAIDQAQTKIEMTMFRLSNDSVVDALIRAHKRGVKIRIILDGKGLSRPGNQADYRRLLNAGILVKPSSTSFSISHAKSMVVDNKAAFITTVNLNGFYANTRDYGVIVEDPGVIAEIDAVFAADWKSADSGGIYTPRLTRPELVWSPINSLTKLTELVNGAKTSIMVTVETLSDPSFVTAIENASRRGIDVRIILPMCSSEEHPTFNYPAIKRLLKADVKVRVMPSPPTPQRPFMHGKMLIVDDTYAYVGSVNFSINSFRYARELGIIFTNREGIQRLASSFAGDWVNSIVPPATPTIHCRTRVSAF